MKMSDEEYEYKRKHGITEEQINTINVCIGNHYTENTKINEGGKELPYVKVYISCMMDVDWLRVLTNMYQVIELDIVFERPRYYQYDEVNEGGKDEDRLVEMLVAVCEILRNEKGESLKFAFYYAATFYRRIRRILDDFRSWILDFKHLRDYSDTFRNLLTERDRGCYKSFGVYYNDVMTKGIVKIFTQQDGEKLKDKAATCLDVVFDEGVNNE